MNSVLKLFRNMKKSYKIINDPYNELINNSRSFCIHLNDRLDSTDCSHLFREIVFKEDITDNQIEYMNREILSVATISLIDFLVASNWFIISNIMGIHNTVDFPREKMFMKQYYYPIDTFLKGNKNIFSNLLEFTTYDVTRLFKDYLLIED